MRHVEVGIGKMYDRASVQGFISLRGRGRKHVGEDC